MLNKSANVLLDNAVIYSKMWTNHLRDLKQALGLFRAKKWKLKRKKCKFGQQSVELLGHVVSKDGFCQDSKKREKMILLIDVTSRAELKSWVHFVQYYQKFVPNFSDVAQLLFMMTSKKVPFVWDMTAKEAMDKLKVALARDVILAFSDVNKLYKVYADASAIAMGFVLVQKGRPVCFGSKVFNSAQRNYSAGDQEILVVVTVLEKFWMYLKGQRVIVWTDHKPLVNYLSQNGCEMLGCKVRVWQKLNRFNVEICYVAGKDNIVADVLSRNPIKLSVSVCV